MIMMEAQEDEVVKGGCCKDNSHIIRGKRTKRQRPLSPLALTMASSSSSGGGGVVGENSGGVVEGVITASPTTSNNEFAESTEEDMANCLILLARGHSTTGRRKIQDQPVTSPSTTPSTALSGSTKGGGGGGGGLYVYQCKTCDRCFPSFQALGGHRASHKKPKAASNNNNMEEKKCLVFMEAEQDIGRFDHATTTLSLQISNRGFANSQRKANKLHECSVCGAEFTSGQALGGHMRRHRAFINTTSATTTTTTTTTTLSVGTRTSPETSQESKKARNINLQLDLNLPAPEDDRRDSSKFPFAANEQVIVFSASPLVDCHY